VQESRAYLRGCRDCCSVLRNAHIARTFGKIRHRGVCWSGTSLLWSLSTRRATNLPAPLLLSPPLLIAGLRNPQAHRLIKDDPERALEFIAFVSTGVADHLVLPGGQRIEIAADCGKSASQSL
jgi:hypothetical protein